MNNEIRNQYHTYIVSISEMNLGIEEEKSIKYQVAEIYNELEDH